MLRPVIVSALLLVIPALAAAETIHLKNGRAIWAEHVRENGSHIEYDVGDNTYALPKTLVDHIDAGGAPPAVSNAGAARKDLPVFVPSGTAINDPTIEATVIRDGQVNEDELASFEQAGNPAKTAAGYFIAGKHEFDRGNFTK